MPVPPPDPSSPAGGGDVTQADLADYVAIDALEASVDPLIDAAVTAHAALTTGAHGAVALDGERIAKLSTPSGDAERIYVSHDSTPASPTETYEPVISVPDGLGS